MIPTIKYAPSFSLASFLIDMGLIIRYKELRFEFVSNRNPKKKVRGLERCFRFLQSDDGYLVVDQCVCKVKGQDEVGESGYTLEEHPDLITGLNEDSTEDEDQRSGEKDDRKRLGVVDAGGPDQTDKVYDTEGQVDGQISAVSSSEENSCRNKSEDGQSKVAVYFVRIQCCQCDEYGADLQQSFEATAEGSNINIEITEDADQCNGQ